MKNSYFYSLFFIILGVIICTININNYNSEDKVKPATPVKRVQPNEPLKLPLQPEPIVSDSIPTDSVRIESNENARRMNYRFLKKTFHLHKKPFIV